MTWKKLIFLIIASYILHSCFDRKNLPNATPICTSCQPIPVNDTPVFLAGEKDYSSYFVYKNDSLRSDINIQEPFEITFDECAATLSRISYAEKAIMEDRSKRFDAIIKAGGRPNQMAPSPAYVFIPVSSFKSDSIKYVSFSGIKKMIIENTRAGQINNLFKDVDFVVHTPSFNMNQIGFAGSAKFLGSYDTFAIDNCRFKKLVYNGDCSLLTMRNVTIDSSSIINLGAVNEISSLYGNGILELRAGNITNPVIILRDVNLDRLNFSLNGLDFMVDTSANYPYEAKISLYQQLINRFANIPDQKIKYDVRRIELINQYENNWFTGFIRKNWNYYGYDKMKIFLNSLLLVLFFFAINLFLYPKMVYQAYLIEQFEKADKLVKRKWRNKNQRFLINLFLCLLYTNFIFWGLKLSFEKIKVTNIWLTIWILLQYITGIICLAYIANVIITR